MTILYGFALWRSLIIKVFHPSPGPGEEFYSFIHFPKRKRKRKMNGNLTRFPGELLTPFHRRLLFSKRDYCWKWKREDSASMEDLINRARFLFPIPLRSSHIYSWKKETWPGMSGVSSYSPS